MRNILNKQRIQRYQIKFNFIFMIMFIDIYSSHNFNIQYNLYSTKIKMFRFKILLSPQRLQGIEFNNMHSMIQKALIIQLQRLK